MVKKQPEKFTDVTVKAPSKNNKSFSINKGKIAKWFFILVFLSLVAGVTAYKTYSFGMKLIQAKDAMMFAYEYPELVGPVAEQYNAELGSLKDSIVKRQTMNLIVEDEGKKE